MNMPAIKTDGFAMQPRTMGEAMDLAGMLANSEMVPKCYKGKKEDTLVAMMMGSELGLNPIQALQNIAVINGRPSIYGDALVALVQNHRAFGGMEEFFDDSSLTATCTVWRKGGQKHTQTFSKQDAEKAGLWNKAGPWTQYPKRMLAMRARGFALRNQFADALAGLITREEAMDMPEIKDVTDYGNTAQAEQTHSAPRNTALPPYPEEQFKANQDKWRDAIARGGSSPDRLISMIGSKFILSEEQKERINNLAPIEGETQ